MKTYINKISNGFLLSSCTSVEENYMLKKHDKIFYLSISNFPGDIYDVCYFKSSKNQTKELFCP